MIRFRDATTLALTKLRTRKVRLIVTVVISGLLFSGLAGASMVARGVIDSINDFGKEGLGDRFITAATAESSYQLYNSGEIVDRAEAINRDIVARKKALRNPKGLYCHMQITTSRYGLSGVLGFSLSVFFIVGASAGFVSPSAGAVESSGVG